MAATIEGIAGSSEPKAEAIDPPPPEWTVRPVSVCYLDPNSAAAARIAIKPNKPKLSGETLTALSRESGTWRTNYRCQLLVEDGMLDVLHLRVPNTWTGPFDVQTQSPVFQQFSTQQ